MPAESPEQLAKDRAERAATSVPGKLSTIHVRYNHDPGTARCVADLYDETSEAPVWSTTAKAWGHVAKATLDELERRYAGQAMMIKHLPAAEVAAEVNAAFKAAMP